MLMLVLEATVMMLSQSRTGTDIHGDKMLYAGCTLCDIKEHAGAV
jgi:hypothetical protein